MAVWAPWTGVLAVGDYLSPVEIPMIGPGASLNVAVAALSSCTGWPACCRRSLGCGGTASGAVPV